jgi:hypothetical protein
VGGGEYGEVRPVKRAYAVKGAHRKEGRRPDLGGRVGLVGDSSSAETELLDGTVAEAKTEESAILRLARNGHHMPGVIGPNCKVHEHVSHE